MSGLKWEEWIPLREKSIDEYIPSTECKPSLMKKLLSTLNTSVFKFLEMKIYYTSQNKELRPIFRKSGRLAKISQVRWSTEI